MKSFSDALLNRFLALCGVDLDFALGMPDDRISQITDGLYLGARPSTEHIQLLKDTGITHVVSVLREEDRSKMAFLDADFEPLFFSIQDRVHQNISATFREFFNFSLEALKSNSRTKLLVHCEAGVSRSATLAIALLMKTERQTFFRAFKKVQAKRPQVLPNIGFASQLQRFEVELQPDGDLASGFNSLTRYLQEICNVPAELHLIQSALERCDQDAVTALHEIFGPELPRVVQGIRF